MTNEGAPFGRIEEFARKHPRWMWVANGILVLFVTIVLLMTTETPIVLYQAF
jgi:hypothetical protein